MTKIDGRDKQTAAKQIEESLKRLQTDVIDLLQHHEVIRLEDPDRIFDEGGAQEAVEAAKKAGKIRYVGFTGHKDPLVHLRMLEIAAKHDFRFDTVQMPLNVMDAHFRSFQKHVLPVLVREGIGVLGMKPMGSGAILDSKTVTPTECLYYALTLPTSVVITGIDSEGVLQPRQSHLNRGETEEQLFQDVGGEACAVAFAAEIIFHQSVRREDGHCQASQHGRGLRGVALANPAGVFCKSYIQHPVQLTLDAPMTADDFGERFDFRRRGSTRNN